MTAKLRFLAFVLIVLGLPLALMAQPGLTDPGRLALILSPALAGTALGFGWWKGARLKRWVWVGLAAAITLGIAGLAVAAAMAAGRLLPGAHAPDGVLPGIAGVALTSVLEELGWAGGGLYLAKAAFGRRAGVIILGLVWAAWHLGPAWLQVGLFPDLEQAPPLMVAAFIVACVVYRELLTRLSEQAGTWLAAAAGHAAPNILLTALIAGGVFVLPKGDDWPFFPAPGGLVFLASATFALWVLVRRTRRPNA